MFKFLGILCFVLFFVALIVSINPKWISRGNDPLMRKYILLAALAMFVLFFVFANLDSGNNVKPAISPSTPTVIAPEKTPEQLAKETEDAKVKAAAEADAAAKIKAAEEAKKLPKVNIAGSVTPTVAQKGDKVVIKIDVENLDSSKTIDGIKLLFSDTKFLEQGLVIVNVMSGGIQNGRAFVWQLEGAKIPPKEKRSYQIVAQANTPGTYQSIIQIKPPSTGQVYSDPEGNEELNAKLVVLN